MIRTGFKKELSSIKNINSDSIVDDYLCSVLASTIFSANKNNESIVEFDIGIGLIIIYICESSIRYRFEPSKTLVDKIKESFSTDEDPLINSLNEKIEYSLYRICRDILK